MVDADRYRVVTIDNFTLVTLQIWPTGDGLRNSTIRAADKYRSFPAHPDRSILGWRGYLGDRNRLNQAPIGHKRTK
jgi:hypothetical protein